MQRLRKVLIVFGSILILVFALNLGVASAHDPDEAAPDTPGIGATTQATAGFGGALANGEAENSLFRNPTCGAHDGDDGIHPPTP